MKKLMLTFMTLFISSTCMAAPPSYGGHMPPTFYSGSSNGTIRMMPNHSGGFNYYDNRGYAGRSTKNIWGGQTYYGTSGYQGFSRPMFGGNGQYGTMFTPSR